MARKKFKKEKWSKSPDEGAHCCVLPEHWIHKILEGEKQPLQQKNDFGGTCDTYTKLYSPPILTYEEIRLLLCSTPSIK